MTERELPLEPKPQYVQFWACFYSMLDMVAIGYYMYRYYYKQHVTHSIVQSLNLINYDIIWLMQLFHYLLVYSIYQSQLITWINIYGYCKSYQLLWHALLTTLTLSRTFYQFIRNVNELLEFLRRIEFTFNYLQNYIELSATRFFVK